jgi:hypothetical protein
MTDMLAAVMTDATLKAIRGNPARTARDSVRLTEENSVPCEDVARACAPNG